MHRIKIQAQGEAITENLKDLGKDLHSHMILKSLSLELEISDKYLKFSIEAQKKITIEK